MLAIPLVLLGILRGETVGGDLENYIPYFDKVCNVNNYNKLWDQNFKEPGYVSLIYVISRVSPTHRAYLIITSLLSLIGPFYLIYRYSPKITLSFYLYYALGFYTNTFNNIRQSLAMSVCFIAVPALLDRNLRKFLLLVILATTLHYSAVFFSLAYPLFGMKFKLKRIFVLFLTIGLLYVLSSVSIMKSLLQIMAFKYNPDMVEMSENTGWSLFCMYLIILLGEIFLFIKYCKNEKDSRRRSILVYCIYAQTLCCLFQMFAPLFSSMSRLTQYFYIPIIVIVPILMDEFKRCSIIIGTVFLCISILFISMTYSKSSDIESNSQGVIPYVLGKSIIY